MHVSVEQTSELSRKMTVSIPEEVIQEKVDARLKSLKSEIKIDGFRPGKIPQKLIKKKYGDKVRGEISGDLLKTSYYEALQQENLTPVDMPDIKPIEQKEGLTYTAEFEIYPTISLESLSDIKAKQPVSTIEADDFDAMIQTLRAHKTEWVVVDRIAENEDRVTLNFSGVCDDKNFTDGKVEDFEVKLGAKQMIPGFEDQLLGLETGNTKIFEISFPENYTGKLELAGKLATFDVEVTKIEKPQLPEIDEEFIKSYGIESGDDETFYADIKANMNQQLKQGLAAELKRSVLDALYNGIEITLPKILVDREISSLKKSHLESAKQQNINIDFPKDIFETEAKRRIGLGLIVSKVIETNKIVVDSQTIRSTIEELSQNYDQPDEIVKAYYEDEKHLEEVKQLVLENQCVEWLTKQMNMVDELHTFSELMAKNRRQQG